MFCCSTIAASLRKKSVSLVVVGAISPIYSLIRLHFFQTICIFVNQHSADIRNMTLLIWLSRQRFFITKRNLASYFVMTQLSKSLICSNIMFSWPVSSCSRASKWQLFTRSKKILLCKQNMKRFKQTALSWPQADYPFRK